MHVLRTPDERFASLPDFPFEPHYAQITDSTLGSLRLHYLDEGNRSGETILLLHGEPSWCYLYRKMIPPLTRAGFRTLAPDLIGFGRSDKPTDRSAHTYAAHLRWLRAFLEATGVQRMILFCQDWGGLLGLRLVADTPDRFTRLAISNSFLPTGDQPPSEGFLKWRGYSQSVPEFSAGGIVQGGTARGISAEVRAAYDAPFPDERYKAGARAFPTLVPITPDDPESANNRAAWAVLQRYEKPVITLFGDSDPITVGADRVLQKLIPGAAGQPHAVLTKVGHFSQEDGGEELAERLISWIGRGK